MGFGEQKGILTEFCVYVVGEFQVVCNVLYCSSHLILISTLGGHYSLSHSPTHLLTELILGIEYLICAGTFLRLSGMRHGKLLTTG